MLPSRLLNSVAFRRAVIYVAVLGAVTTVVLGFLYHNASAVVARQTETTIEAEVLGLAEQYRQFGLGQLVRVIESRSRGDPGRRSIYLLADPAYQPLAGNLSAWPQDATTEPGLVGFSVTREDESGAVQQKALARTYDLRGGLHLLVGRDMAEQAAVKDLILDSLLFAGLATGGLAVLGGLLMSQAILRRIEGISRGCQAILDGDLKRRMPETRRQDEFDRLSHNLNVMLDRIENLMTGMRDVADAIAHDLRSPIARLRGRLERGLMEGGTSSEAYRQTIEEGLRATDEILATFAAVLNISLAESGALREEFADVDLSAIARDVTELYAPVAEDEGLAIRVEADGPLLVRGHRHLLFQSLANLIDNAVKYAGSGDIVVAARRGTSGAELVVADHGPGIPGHLRDKALQRFTRLDESRSKPGNGLGLALVAAVAHLHGAGLSLEDNAPGLRVRLTFGGATNGRAPS